MITACTRLSGLMFMKPRLMDAMAPEDFRVFITRTAPVMMISTSRELRTPYRELAASAAASIPHRKKANAQAIAQEMIRQRFAGQLNTIISTSVATMGKKATTAKTNDPPVSIYQILATPDFRAASATASATALPTLGSKAAGMM